MEIRPYQPGDEIEISSLFINAFGKPMPEGFWEWRYKSNPFCKDVMIHMMWDGKTLAGHYAVSPVEMNVDGKKSLTALSMTTMTHSAYAGRGIFSTLAESLYKEISEKHQVEMVWGFPNSNSHYAFIKNLAWNDIATIPFLTLKVGDPKPYTISGYRAVKSFDDLKVEKLASVQNASIRINKTKQYLQWRYFDNPSFNYQLLELGSNPECFIVFKIFNSFSDAQVFEADILELGSDDMETSKTLISALISHSIELGKPVTKINTWESLFSKRHSWLEKFKFTMSAPVTFLGARPLRKGFDNAHDYSQWEIGMGYSDVF